MKEPAGNEPAMVEEPVAETVELETSVEKAVIEPTPVDEPVVEVVTVEKPLEKVAADPALSKQTDGEVVAPAVVAKPSPTMAETKSARATTVSEPAQPLPALDEGDRYAGVVAESAWRDDAVEIVLMPTIREMELTDERPGGAPVVSPRRVAALKPAEPSSGSPEKKQTTLTGEPASSEGSKAISDHKKSSIQLLLKLAAADIEQRRLTRPRGDNAQEKYQAVLRLDPDNELAKAGLNRIVDRYLEIAREALADGKRFRARQRLLRAESVLPGTERVKRMRESLEAAKKRKILPRIKRPARKPVVDAAPAEQRPAEVEKLLAAAERYTDRNMLTQPPGMNALENYQQVLKLDPGNERALQGMQRLVELYLIIARRAIREGKLLKARNRLWRALHIDPSAREAEKLLTKVEQRLRRN